MRVACAESSDNISKRIDGAVVVQTGERCADATFQAPLYSTFSQLLLKTENEQQGREGKTREGGQKLKRL